MQINNPYILYATSEGYLNFVDENNNGGPK